MAKRTASIGLSYPRRDLDLYETWDPNAVLPLLPHLPNAVDFCEPCAGSRKLIDQLQAAGHRCVQASDIAPRSAGVEARDALDLTTKNMRGDFIITNPPWSRPVMHAMIEHFRKLAPTWVLFDADWKYTEQKLVAKKYDVPTTLQLLAYCHKIVAVGRVVWIEGTKKRGTQDCAWYLFTEKKNTGAPLFYPVGYDPKPYEDS